MNVRLPGAVLAAAAVIALAACGSSSGDSTGTPAGAAKAATTKTATKAAAAKAVDVCTVLPAAQAAKLSGQPYTVAAPANNQGWTSGCAYNNDDATAEGVNVNLDTSDAAANTWKAVDTGSVSTINGLGDKAFWDNDNTLYAMAGPALIQVNGLDRQDKSAALAKVVIDAMH